MAIDDSPIKVRPFERVFYEFIGSTVVVFVGLGSVAVLGGPISHAFAEGFVYWATLSLFLAFGAGHFNPAITLVKAVLVWFMPTKNGGRFRWYYAGFIIAQFLGAFAASLLVWAITGDRTFSGLGMPVLGPGKTAGNGVWSELIFPTMIIFIYCVTMMMMASQNMQAEMNFYTRANIIGIAIVAFTLVGHLVSGANFNPFRFLGPALLAWDFGPNGHIYIWPPFIGSIIAGVAIGVMIYYRSRNRSKKTPSKKTNDKFLTTR